MKIKPRQNEISQSFLKGSDLNLREQEVLKDAAIRTGFKPQKLLSRSSWWTSKQIGAFHYLGKYKNKNAIMKIQGVKPEISEIYMIQSFKKANKSKIIRPPYLYTYLKWDDKKRYEALVLEDTGNTTVINSPTNQKEVDEFYNLYYEYRKNCLSDPWIEKPDEGISEMIKTSFENWKIASYKLYPKHSLREEDDQKLIDKAVEVLIKNYQNVELEFMHGHFSATDLYKVGGDIVLLSNLYWSYRNPFRDGIFAYHWFSYGLSDLPNIMPTQIDEQRRLWLEKINMLPKNGYERKLLKLALLERATAGLNLDALSIDPQLKASKYLVSTARRDVEELIQSI
ncbi:MAG: hypothetical protein A3A51_03565 [Candidatus Levybacteria bacterium RIFCSPLOWO2_01_FULL_39_10]|nr:MAG: hypothetical protein A3A51_03565 [Candidatus Levybacteria bacterium RIFCSPLOWO2_01_FULL_39_10]